MWLCFHCDYEYTWDCPLKNNIEDFILQVEIDFTEAIQSVNWILNWNWSSGFNIHMESQETQHNWNNFDKEQNRKITFSDFKTYYEEIFIKSVMLANVVLA